MAVVISISVTESSEQVIADIPRFITITTNIPSSIFYTLDGLDPTVFSTVYVGKFELPTNQLTLTLKILAVSGEDTSPITTYTYQTTMTGNIRSSHHGTTDQANSTVNYRNLFPFGTTSINPEQVFTNSNTTGLTVDDPNKLPRFSTAYDVNQNPTAFTNTPQIGISTNTYPLIYSEANAQGEMGHGIGNLPTPSTVQTDPPPPEQSNLGDKLFNPKAMVLFQDFTKPLDPTDPVEVNRMHFSLDDDKAFYGSNYMISGPDVQPTSGSFLRSHYNPTDSTMNYYYRDSKSGRWIISKTPFNPSKGISNYYNVVFGRDRGAGFIFKWIPFKHNYLY